MTAERAHIQGRIQHEGRNPWLAGARTAAPFVGAYFPFALVIGALADQTSINDFLGWSTAWLNYAGTSQLVILQMYEAGAAPAVIILAVAMISLRLVAYSTALSPLWRTAPTWWKALAANVLVDPSYVIAMQQVERDGAPQDARALQWHRRYYLGAALTLWVTWPIGCGIGVALGAQAVRLLPMGTLADLMLVCMLGLLVKDYGTRVAGGAGLVLGVPAVVLPAGMGPAVAALAAVAMAAVAEKRSSS
ncbi:AzlC family ABC transporter permease [Streptomyces sp. Lzd4kr]|nr:AzlC family ABC transporter permease [Streptomyces sp. Lzd4kr]